MTTAENFLAAVPPARPEPPIVNGRYEIPDPITGERRTWQRATNYAKSIADNFAIEQWKLRKTGLGVATHPELAALIASVRDPDSKDGKKKLDELTERARDYAGSDVRSGLGTAVHAFTESIDTGHKVPDGAWTADLNAYAAEIKRMSLTVSKNYVERICLLPELGVAGTLDRLVKFFSGLPLIGDIKTGANVLKYQMPEITIQLALYAHAEYLWDEATKQVHKMPAVNQDLAIVFHMPAGEGRCTAYYVDIKSGWQAVNLCRRVRDWRKRRDLAWPVLAVEKK